MLVAFRHRKFLSRTHKLSLAFFQLSVEALADAQVS